MSVSADGDAQRDAQVSARPVVTRRRGAALVGAIHTAALEEVAEVGFEAATMESIAARASAGKASLYKRWASLDALVLDALGALDDPLTDLREQYEEAEHVDVCEALVDVFTRYAAGLDSAAGKALRSLMTSRERHPELYAQVFALTVGSRQRLTRLVLDRAGDQIDPSRVTPWTIGAGPRLLIAQHMERGVVTRDDVEAVVDQIVLPSLGWPFSRRP